MTRMTKTFRLWAMIVSVFAVFNVAGLSASAMPVVEDEAAPCADCPENMGAARDVMDLRRKHSDLV